MNRILFLVSAEIEQEQSRTNCNTALQPVPRPREHVGSHSSSWGYVSDVRFATGGRDGAQKPSLHDIGVGRRAVAQPAQPGKISPRWCGRRRRRPQSPQGPATLRAPRSLPCATTSPRFANLPRAPHRKNPPAKKSTVISHRRGQNFPTPPSLHAAPPSPPPPVRPPVR
jgi:hypothetical protein